MAHREKEINPVPWGQGGRRQTSMTTQGSSPSSQSFQVLPGGGGRARCSSTGSLSQQVSSASSQAPHITPFREAQIQMTSFLHLPQARHWAGNHSCVRLLSFSLVNQAPGFDSSTAPFLPAQLVTPLCSSFALLLGVNTKSLQARKMACRTFISWCNCQQHLEIDVNDLPFTGVETRLRVATAADSRMPSDGPGFHRTGVPYIFFLNRP